VKPGARIALLAALVAVLASLLGLFLCQKKQSVSASGAKSENPAQTSAASASEASASIAAAQKSTAARRPVAGPQNPVAQLLSQIEAALDALEKNGTGSRDANKSALDALRDALRGANPRDAIAAITQFLASGRDAGTGLPFEIGAGGALDNSPTLRVFLIDQLGQIAHATGANSPEDAQIDEISRGVLSTKNSADEWAVSMRNVAWTEQNSAPFLEEKFREMLDYKPWVDQPSAGFLQAFDAAVYAHDISILPQLAALMQTNDVRLQQAAGVALDRLAAADPLDVMNYLNSNPGLFADRPLLRADYFTKTDLSDPAQRQALETYLSRSDVSTAEKTKLLSGLLAPGTFVSDNLLTPLPAPPTDESSTRQQNALNSAINDWLASNRFPDIRSQLQQTQTILQARPQQQ